MDHPLPWLRYVDADSITAPDLSFDGMKVRNDAMETLGSVEGFIVDNTSMRPYYVVVDSGGWFKSNDFLVPIGHARIDDDRDALVVDIPKARIERFPGFDRSEFERLKEEDVRRMNDAICGACNDTTVVSSSGEPIASAWDRADYRQPSWWSTTGVGFDRGADRGATDTGYIATADYPAGKVDRAMGEVHAEQELQRERTHTPTRVSKESERDAVVAREADPSPYLDGRAQPGDVIGLETGGEQTHIGETAEDENKRRIDAERDGAKRRD